MKKLPPPPAIERVDCVSEWKINPNHSVSQSIDGLNVVDLRAALLYALLQLTNQNYIEAKRLLVDIVAGL